MKTCTVCNKNKDLICFAFKNKANQTRQPKCKECVKEWDRIAYKDGRKNGSDKESRMNLRHNRMNFVYDYLSAHPCVDCGESNIIVLEFDHLGDKYKDVMILAQNRASEKVIMQEIKKCEVVCANHHRIRTYTRCNSLRVKHTVV